MEVKQSDITTADTPEAVQAEAEANVTEVLKSASPEDTPAELAAKAMRAGVVSDSIDKSVIGEAIDQTLRGKPVEGISEATNATVEDLSQLSEKAPRPKIIAAIPEEMIELYADIRIQSLVMDIEKMFAGNAVVFIKDERDQYGKGEYSINFQGGVRQSECIHLSSSNTTILRLARTYCGRGIIGLDGAVS